jgi:hypothetical protein
VVSSSRIFLIGKATKLTFTMKAAGELKRQAGSAGVEIPHLEPRGITK